MRLTIFERQNQISSIIRKVTEKEKVKALPKSDQVYFNKLNQLFNDGRFADYRKLLLCIKDIKSI